MSKEYKINHTKAWCYFIASGLLPYNAKKNEWVLHHKDMTLKDTDPIRYNEWRIEDLEPMLKSEHTRLHQKNRHMSEDTKAKIRAALKGHEVSEETRRKLSESQKGKKLSEETIRKRTATYRANHPLKPKVKKPHKPKDQKCLYWINDGRRNKRISKDAVIPEGWSKGRIGGWKWNRI